MSRPRVILFGGASGVGKTPMATYLSWKLGWGVFSTDALRNEVSATYMHPVVPDEENQAYLRLRDQRLKEAVELGRDFILDASIDRQWENRRDLVRQQGYTWFIISFDLSYDFLLQLYAARGKSTEHAQRWYLDHQEFLERFGGEVGFSITDKNYRDRVELAFAAVSGWLRA